MATLKHRGFNINYNLYKDSAVIRILDPYDGRITNTIHLSGNLTENEIMEEVNQVLDVIDRDIVSKTLQLQLHRIEKTHPGILQDGMLDFLKIFDMGAQKYALNNWLEPNGSKASHKDMHASMFRHLAASSAGINKDEESRQDHLLHLAARAIMTYIRRKRGIVHNDDK